MPRSRKSWRSVDGEGMSPQRLEAILRHYAEFMELYRTHGVEEIRLEDGTEVNVHDLLRGIDELPKNQRQALVLTVLYNLKEKDAANVMGFVRWSSPVGTYKRQALATLVERHWSGSPNGRKVDSPSEES